MSVVVLVVIGLIVGVVGGMLGVGGGIVLIPALNEVFGPDQHLYQATGMIVNVFVAVPAVYQHHCVKAIELRSVLRLMPLSIATVYFGVAVSELSFFAGSGEANLRFLFGAFLFACAVYDAYRLWRRREPAVEDAVPRMTWRNAALVAVPTGFFSGLLGVGGGVVAVPLQRRLLHVPMRTAIANSAAIVAATSLMGAIFKNYAFLREADADAQPMVLAAVLIPTAVIGSLVGSRLTHRIPLRAVKSVFIVVLAVAALRLMYGALVLR